MVFPCEQARLVKTVKVSIPIAKWDRDQTVGSLLGSLQLLRDQEGRYRLGHRPVGRISIKSSTISSGFDLSTSFTILTVFIFSGFCIIGPLALRMYASVAVPLSCLVGC